MRSTAAWRLGVIGFTLAAMLLAAVGWMTLRHLDRLREATGAVQHTLLVRTEADGLLSLLKDAETGQRGFWP